MRIAALRLIVAALPAGPGLAQSDDARLPAVRVESTRPPATLSLGEPIDAASRLGVPAREVPASVEVIDRAALRERGKRTTIEALEGATGLSVGTPGGSPGVVTSRGFADNSVRYLYDGVPLPDAGMVTRPGGTFNIDRIEILRGPSSVMHGTQGLGGAVNFVSRAPSRTPQPVDLEAGIGTQDARRIGLGSGGPLGTSGLFWRFDASTTRFDTFQAGNRHQYDRLTGALAYDVAPRMTVSLHADWLHDRQQDSYWGTPLDNGRIDPAIRKVNYNNLTDNRFQGETLWLRGNFDWKPANGWEIRNSLYHYDSFRNWRNVENYTYNAAARTVTRSSFGDLDHDHTMLGDRFDALFRHRLLGRENRIAIGFDVNRTTFKGRRNGFPGSQVVDAFDPAATSFFSVPGVIEKFPARDVTIDQQAVFLEDQWSLTPSFRLVAGLRQDRIEADFVRTDSGSVQTAPVTYSKRWSPLGTRVGFVHDLTPRLTWYAQHTTGSEPVGTVLLLTQANIDFELTRGRMIEVGLKGDFWDRRAEWSLAAYRIVKKDILIPVTPTLTEQAGQQSSKGFEFAIGARPLPGLRIEANAAVLEARFDAFNQNVGGVTVSRAGNTPPNVPRKIFNLGVRQAVATHWAAGAWVRHVGRRFTDIPNGIEMPAYTTVDLSMSYRIAPRHALELWVRNATDELYAQYRGAGDNQVILGMPRTIELVWRGQF